MRVRTYVCMYVCVWQSCVWKMACVKVTWVRDSADILFASAAMSSALDAAALQTWNGLNEVFHDLLCSMWCNEMFYVTAAPVLQPRIRRWWHRGKVPGRKSVELEHECSWLSMQLWKTSTERMPVKSRHSHSGKHHGYDAHCAVFSKYVNQPQIHWCGMPEFKLVCAVDVRSCHACHVKSRWMSRKVPRRHGRHARLNRAQGRHPVPWVRRLPRKTTVDVRLCHACHVKSRWMSPSATPATQSAAASRASRAATKPGPRAPPSAMSEAPATQNVRGCEIVPRLPREIKVDVTKCHACHAKCRGVTGVTRD